MTFPRSSIHSAGAGLVTQRALVLGILSLPSLAWGQTLGAPGTFAIGVENVTGYNVETRKYDDQQDEEQTDTTTQFSFLLKSGAKVGVHYFVWPQVSLGGTLGYQTSSGSHRVPDGGGSFSIDKERDDTFLLHPKIGYLLPIGSQFGFWFRAGPGFYRNNVHADPLYEPESTETFWLLGADILFVYAPVPVVGFFVGPGADFSMIGRHSEYHLNPGNRSFSNSASYRRLGLDLGLMVLL